MAASPALSIRVAANLTDLNAALTQGVSQITTVTAAMQKLASSLDGSKLIQQAQNIVGAVQQIGGVATLTEAQQARLNSTLDAAIEKYELLGQTAPQAMVALRDETEHAATSTGVLSEYLDRLVERMATYFAVYQIAAFSEEVLKGAEQIQNLSVQLGVSTDILQGWKYAADVGGSSIDQVASMVQFMGRTIAQDAPLTETLIEKIGLSFATIRDDNPADAFKAIGQAIAGTADPMLQAEAASKLLGRSSGEVVGLMKSGFFDIAANAPVMSAAVIKADAEMESDWRGAWDQMQVIAGTTLGQLRTAVPAAVNGYKAALFDLVTTLNLGIGGHEAFVAALRAAATAAAQAGAATAGATPPIVALTEAQKLAIAQNDLASHSYDQLSPAVQRFIATQVAAKESSAQIYKALLDAGVVTASYAGAVSDLVAADKNAETAAEAHAKAVKDAADAQDAYGAALLWLIPNEAQVIADLAAHDMSIKDVAAATGDTVIQVQAVSDAMKANAAENKSDDAEQKTLLAEWKSQYAQWTAEFVAMNKTQADEAAKSIQTRATAFLAGQKAIETATLDLGALQENTSASVYDAQVNNIQKWAQQQTQALQAALDKQGAWTDASRAQFAAYGAIIDQEVIAKIDKIGPAWAVNGGAALSAMKTDFQALASVTTGTMSTIASDTVKGIGAVQALGKSVAALKDETITWSDGTTSTATDWAGLASVGTSLFGVFMGLASMLQEAFAQVWPTAAQTAVTAIQALGSDTLPYFGSLADSVAFANAQLQQLQGTATLTQPVLDELFTNITAGGANSTTALGTLSNLVTTMAGQATKTSGIWSAQLQDLIAQSEKLGLNVAGITSALAAAAASATTGLNTALGVTSSAYTASATDQTTISTSTSATDIATATADLKVQQGIIAATQITSQAAASGLAAAALATVAANEKAGMSFEAAAKAAAPAIQGLQAELAATGFSGSAAFAALSNEANLLTDAVAGPAITAVEGYTSAMVSLANTGQLTQDSFTGLEAQIGSTYATLIAQGQDGQAVLAALQPDLQAAWQAEQQYGYKADDATQALIDQGVAAGTVGEKQKSATDQMLDGINQMVTALNKVVQAMTGPNGMTSAASAAAASMSRSFASVTGPSFSSPSFQMTSGSDGSVVPPATSGAPYSGGDSEPPPGFTGPVGDSPLTSISAPGFVWLRPGDIYGMTHLTPGFGAAAGPSSTVAPIAGSSGGGQMAQIVNNIVNNIYQQPGEDSNALALRIVQAVTGSGKIATALVNGGTSGIRSILSQQGLV